jgi:hypothetical protein
MYAETVGYASHSLETIFTNPFKTTYLVQLMFGKPIYKSEFKWIQTYSNRLGYCRSQIVKPVVIKKDDIDKRSFLKLSFANEDLDAINLSIILHHKSVESDDQILSNEL